MKQIIVMIAAVALAGVAAAQGFVWVEGENPASTNVKPNTSGWGRKEFLSGGAWLTYAVAEDKVKDTVPQEGILVKYAFDVAVAGEHEIWARIGYEFARSPFEWRVDSAEWRRVASDALTTDLMELDNWCEVAWLQLAKQTLAVGAHTIEFRITPTQDDKGKTQRILFGLDALCISPKPFFPHSRFKPGEDWRTERDREAAAHTFTFGGCDAGQRAWFALSGIWEVCRNDEMLPPADIAQPMMDFPKEPRWTAIDVPGDKNKQRPDLLFAHRLWYRTKVDVPESMMGRAYLLRFPQNNLNTTVFVNGTYCGFFAYPFADFTIDVTAGIKPGVNEIWVGIRDAWYGYSTNPDDPMKLRKKFNIPLDFFGKGFQDLAWPIWNHAQSGILKAPEFIMVGGPVYVSDVFVKPSVAKKEIAVEVTIVNTTKEATSGELMLEIFNDGKAEKKFAPYKFALAAGETKTFERCEPWANPKLWWPDEPNLYWLMAEAKTDKGSDIPSVRFGFREWDWSGRDFKLNGIVWHGWADCFQAGNKDEWLKFYKEKNQTVMRFWGTTWQGMAPREALDFFDVNGVVCRRSGILDGEMIGYNAIENDPALKKESPIKMDLMRNWRGQMAAQVRGERNHPSVMLWSIENEYLYINCINLHGNHMDLFEAESKVTADEVMRVDPTRPVMVDGGGAAKAQTLPVHGDHYITAEPCRYPPFAYETNPTGGGRGRWVWDETRPRFIGEDFYMSGNHPEVAAFQGDSAFAGKPVRGVGIWNRILQEGYRWAGQSAWHFWLSQNDIDATPYTAYAARAVFSRDWNWTFASGASVARTFGIFNDTRHADPITFTWTFIFDTNPLMTVTDSMTCTVAPGSHEVVKMNIGIPKFDSRKESQLILTLTVGGKEVFTDTKDVSILPPQKRDMPGIGKNDLVVFDPEGAAAAFLAAHKIPCTFAASLDALPQDWKILVIGGNALDARESASSRLAALAATGRRIIILDQDTPLRYQGLPAEMTFSENAGFTAFIEDDAHPLTAGLQSKDFFTFGGDAPVYRNAYEKPTRGARSLIQCHDLLRHTALAETPVGEGLIITCQINLAAQLAANPAAQQLLLNMLGHAAAYKLEHHPVAAHLDGAPALKAALDTIGLQYTPAADPLAALAAKTPATLIANASPKTLRLLAGNLPAVKRFTSGGGTLILCGLTPEGLADYNAIVGAGHVIRPFGRERVTLPAHRSRLTAGLTAADVTLYSAERIFSWTAGNYVASDVFTHVIDHDDIAPFGTSPFGNYRNIVNGFVSADGWPLIINFPINADNSPFQVPITLPKEYTLAEFTWIGNTFYWPQKRVNLIFDNDRAAMLTFPTAPNAEPHTFPIDPPRRAKSVTLEIAEWEPVPGKGALIGIDNISLKVAPRGTALPLTAPAGLMEYPDGPGRTLLCNLHFKDTEDVPENAAKKRRILTAILQNLKAPFSGGRTLVAGMNLNYRPIDLSKHCTQYRDDKGWFGDKARTFRDLPAGRQRMAGVPFDIYDMPTSPVPNALMPRGPGIPGDLPPDIKGVPLRIKADALFFLHAARIDKTLSDRDKRDGKTLEIARYVIRYADGQTIEIPVTAEADIGHYAQKTPAPLPRAQIAWVKRYDNSDDHAVAYMKQWDNPRPHVEILTLDLLPGKDNAGTPALLALTAAEAAALPPN